MDRSVILVTSAVSGEGKSVTAGLLARAIAESGRRTILVDANLYRPDWSRSPAAATKSSGANPARSTAVPVGLLDVLRGRVLPEEALSNSGQSNLLILGRGRGDSDAADMMAQPAMEHTLAALREQADVIILDAPACSEQATSLLLAPLADYIVQVIGAGHVDEEPVRQTSVALGAARPRLLAFFLNFAPEPKFTRIPKMLASFAVPSFGLARPGHAERLAERNMIEENKTTEVIVQHLPGGAPLVRLAWSFKRAPTPHEAEPDDPNVTWLHLENHQR